MNRRAGGRVLVVTGLSAEARLLRGPETICVAAPPASLEAKLEAVLPSPERLVAVVSFGLCGGLDMALQAGAIVVASTVVADGQGWSCDPVLHDRLRRRLNDNGVRYADGSLAACDAPVMTRLEKADLYRRTRALAVDTESHIAARFAAARGLPFAVLRAVADTAGSDLPPLAMRAVDAEGRLDLSAIASELIGQPGQLLQLPGTALSTLRAMRALGRVRRSLGPRLGL